MKASTSEHTDDNGHANKQHANDLEQKNQEYNTAMEQDNKGKASQTMPSTTPQPEAAKCEMAHLEITNPDYNEEDD
eukprot:8078574-Prorocentrum_lima.AAC.1